ncbi:hypothetical protein TREMEDRAFT_73857 [Tremella mesenterica DSM 1558]|uniref:uncharacterized protein n=1 Tax=Tremella mesenterica (strain ATCC 24925 / CBS 8224 / DSM 1558 / NBRC 9311 / NRRL Y-6157 / RJB 2259-6 / UBC 559-6) TaxID=578456 RepID=UPI0003F48CBF|nr:uncharacterized protein TREMEDRAFT_73857 [Tremella mesenterica DSM 1558]EIW69439.1 hypothetical protein TREMEDRAFT_73857 [Tremella mesenterica DSM 1558]
MVIKHEMTDVSSSIPSFGRPVSWSGERDDGTNDLEHEEDNDYSPGSGDQAGWNAPSGSGQLHEGARRGKEKRGLIARVNLFIMPPHKDRAERCIGACNNCRRMKMRCVGAEDPPCKRCRNSGLECVMEKPGRNAGDSSSDDRIRSLENKVSGIQDTLSELVVAIRASLSAPQPAVPSVSSERSPALNNGYDASSRGGVPSQIANAYKPPLATTLGSLAPHGGGFNLAHHSPYPSSAIDRSVGPFSRSGSNFRMTPINQPSSSSINTMKQETPSWGAPARPQLNPIPSSSTQLTSQSTLDTEHHRGQRFSPVLTPRDENDRPYSTLPPSRAGSLGPDDLLDAETITNPLGAMSNMAGLVEAAVERAREEQAKSMGNQHNGNGKRPFADSLDGTTTHKVPKKSRLLEQRPTGHEIVEAQNLPPTPSGLKGKTRARKTHVHAFPDAVAEGYVSEEEGREMMKVCVAKDFVSKHSSDGCSFYAGSSNYIPCYDPVMDTWESLRLRSPFSITAIIYVGARVRDGGGEAITLPIAAAEVAENRQVLPCGAFLICSHAVGVSTLFNPVTRIEAVQGMILLSTFSNESGWLPGGHAVRMAIDMGINKSFLLLLKSGMGRGKSKEELEQVDRPLVVQSRVWFCLYLMEHQMAYGTGRPAILAEDETIQHARPPLHVELTASPDQPLTETAMQRLKEANAQFDAWEREWDIVFSKRFSKTRGDFFRESLIIQRQYAELFVNSQLLRGIRDPHDVVNMPEEKRLLAIRAMRNAQTCLDICLHGQNYRNGLRYAVHYVHVCAAFAASFLIRIARLFPHELDLKKTAKDVEELATVLAEIPAGRYARSLRLILRRARRNNVIPAPSAATSPLKSMAALPAPAMAQPEQHGLPFSLSPLMSSQPHRPQMGPSQIQPVQAPAASPGNAFFAQNPVLNESPLSGQDIFEFDSLFAQETLERAGLTLDDSNQLPLFLDGQSLGAEAGMMEMVPYLGLEQYFLPANVDDLLGQQIGGPRWTGADQTGQPSGQGNVPGDVWW